MDKHTIAKGFIITKLGEPLQNIFKITTTIPIAKAVKENGIVLFLFFTILTL